MKRCCQQCDNGGRGSLDIQPTIPATPYNLQPGDILVIRADYTAEQFEGIVAFFREHHPNVTIMCIGKDDVVEHYRPVEATNPAEEFTSKVLPQLERTIRAGVGRKHDTG